MTRQHGALGLRTQINVRILLLFLVILLLGGSVAIWRARQAVQQEVASSVNLVLQWVEFGLSRPSHGAEADWLAWLGNLHATRHLRVRFEQPTNFRSTPATITADSNARQPPRWFAALVAGDYPETRHFVTTAEGKTLTLIIQPNPLDETLEVWHETLVFLLGLCLLVGLTFVAVHLTLRRSLDMIDGMVEGLARIENGDYHHPVLPDFPVREFAGIARAINHLAAALDGAAKENRALSRHVLHVQEQERRNLAQELHDELGQSLTAIKVMTLTAARDPAMLSEISASIAAMCDHLMGIVRSMMRQLHPLSLTELGIKAALDALIDHWTKRQPTLTIAFDCDAAADALDEDVAIQIYRVTQECLTNAVRHAMARRIDIVLRQAPSGAGWCLTISDDGRGCDMTKIDVGFGLRNIQERIKSLGGACTITSVIGQGMQVCVSIP